jgi:hypothetical protein
MSHLHIATMNYHMSHSTAINYNFFAKKIPLVNFIKSDEIVNTCTTHTYISPDLSFINLMGDHLCSLYSVRTRGEMHVAKYSFL